MEELKKYADKIAAQNFTYRGMPLTNVIGIFNPEAKRKVPLCAHWDTPSGRPGSCSAAAPARLLENDGASGVSVLLELARNFKEQKPEIGVVMVFF